MKLSTILLAATATLSVAYAQTADDTSAGTVAPGGGADATTAPVTTTAAPTTAATTSETPASTTAKPSESSTTTTTTNAPSGSSGSAPATSGSSTGTSSGPTNTAAGNSPLDGLKQKTYGSEYHMPYIRVVQARVQSDKPELVKGRFVSKFGNGDLQNGYRSGLDTVNTASVEGALMFVQAEGINQNARAEKDRCVRKNEMNYVVLYEILIAQTNETIAQFEDKWNIPEYGPMIPMDSGRCTPLKGDDVFPPECLQMNGDKGQPNIGPFVGGGLKDDDVRAPYPNTYWFSFPNTCPLKVWGEKNDANNACRASTRKGLCDIGQAPDGFNCTFAYDVLGWVPIDDVVGITAIKDDNGKAYKNFTTWCEASSEHIEFAGDDRTGKMDKGLDFWKDPLNTTRNAERAAKVVDLYQDILAGDFKSGLIPESDLKYFKDLPSPQALTEMNPPCYKSVRTCNSGAGCKRSGFSQICMPCKDGETCKVDASYTLPKLEKAKTTLSDEELSSGSALGGKNGATGSINKKNSTAPAASAASPSTFFSSAMAATFAASAVVALAL